MKIKAALSWFFFLFTSICINAQIDVNHVISVGHNALYFKDYVVAISYFNQAINARDWMAEPYLYRSIAKISLEDYQGALADATKAIERNHLLQKAYLVRGISYINLRDTVNAIKDYKQGLIYSPEDEGLRYNLAVAEYSKKNYSNAIQQLDSLSFYSPNNIDGKRLYAECLLAKGDTTRALVINNKILTTHSNYIPSLFLKANIQSAKKQFSEAINTLDKIVEIDNTIPETYINRGMLLYNLNNYVGAMNDYSEAIKLSPKDITALTNRALLRSKVGEYNKSIEDWGKVISINPKDFIALYNRALLFIRIGKYENALSDINKVLEHYPAFIDGFSIRSNIYKNLGQSNRSTKDMLRVYELRTNKALHKKIAQQNILKTRTEDDNDIEKYNQLISNNISLKNKSKYNNELTRGRIQDNDVFVKPQPIFTVSLYQQEGASQINSYYSVFINKYNEENRNFKLYIVKDKQQLNNSQLYDINQSIYNLKKDDNIKKQEFYLGLCFYHELDYDNAITYLSNTIADNNETVISLFLRSLVYYFKDNLLKKIIKQDYTKESSDKENFILQKNQYYIKRSLDDLNKLIELNSNIPYAYYNRAYIYNQLSDKKNAIEDYTKCINIRPSIGEAYFNRGLVYLSIGEVEKGLLDMSKAGELGIFESYNIIKRVRKK